MASDRMNPRPMLPAPTQPTTWRGSRRPNSALIRKPVSGARRTSGASVSTARLLLHQIESVDIHLPAGSVDLHDDRDADHHLGRSDGDHQEGKDDAIEGIQVAADGREGEVHCVEHQFDAHEDDERVAANQEADRPHREQRAAQEQKGIGGNRHQRILRTARYTAPTAAISSSTEVTSTGKRNFVYSAVPTLWTLPTVLIISGVNGPDRPVNPWLTSRTPSRAAKITPKTMP